MEAGTSGGFPNSTSYPDSFVSAQPIGAVGNNGVASATHFLASAPIHSSSSYTSSLSGVTTGTGSSPSNHWSPRHANGPRRLSGSHSHQRRLPTRRQLFPAARQLAAELDQLVSGRPPPAPDRGLLAPPASTPTLPVSNGFHTGSLPRSLGARKPPSVPGRGPSVEAVREGRTSGRRKKASVASLGSQRGKREVSPGGWIAKKLHRLALANRSTSAPNLGPTPTPSALD